MKYYVNPMNMNSEKFIKKSQKRKDHSKIDVWTNITSITKRYETVPNTHERCII